MPGTHCCAHHPATVANDVVVVSTLVIYGFGKLWLITNGRYSKPFNQTFATGVNDKIRQEQKMIHTHHKDKSFVIKYDRFRNCYLNITNCTFNS